MRKSLLFSALLLLAVCAVVGDSLFGFFQPAALSVTVPDLCGKQESSLSLPEGMSLVTLYRHSDEVPRGAVIEQAPSAGIKQKISARRPCEIKITVSLGSEEVPLPNVVGLDYRSAAAQLRNAGFSVREEFVLGSSPDLVLRTDPPAGSRLPLGSSVCLYIGAPAASPSVSVPNLVGLSRANALMQIFQSGLSLDSVLEEPSSSPAGTVIRQSPEPSSLVSPSSSIRIVVSAGNE